MHEIQRLQSKHLKIIELVLNGSSDVRVALELGLTPVGVSLIRRSPLFQEELSRRREERLEKVDEVVAEDSSRQALDIFEKLKGLGGRAVEVQEELLESESETVRQRSAMDILDRVGLKPEQNAASPEVVINIQVDKFERIQAASEEILGESIGQSPKESPEENQNA